MKYIVIVFLLISKCFAQSDSSALLKVDTVAMLGGYRTAIDDIRVNMSAGGITQAQADLLYQPIGSYATTAQLALKADQTSISNINNTSDLSKPISTATQTALNLKSDKTTLTTTGVLGYATGAGGTVTQATNKTTGVTLNKTAGQITMNGAALTAGSEVAFTVTNSTVAATDVVIVNVQSVGTAGAYLVGVGAVSNGSFSITVSNASAGSLSQAIVLNFVVIKSVNN